MKINPVLGISQPLNNSQPLRKDSKNVSFGKALTGTLPKGMGPDDFYLTMRKIGRVNPDLVTAKNKTTEEAKGIINTVIEQWKSANTKKS
jgi:hypothetical protein